MTIVGQPKEALDTPALWVDLDQLERNIREFATHFSAAGVNWRPHTKGIKVPAVAHMALGAGAIGVTCAKVGEAEVMAAAGIRDILIAHQIVTPAKIERLVGLQRHADVKVTADCAANVDLLGDIARRRGAELGVLVELNIGMNRAGIDPGEPALELARRIGSTPGLRYRGVMGWEGHCCAITDPHEKRQAILKAMGLLTSTARLFREAGLPPDIVSCGGSATYEVSAHQPGVTEVQAGGGTFSDSTYEGWGVKTRPALFVRATVTSLPAPDRAIVDAGFKALPAWRGIPRAMGVEGVKEFRPSAEHGKLSFDAPNTTLRVGDGIDFEPGYGDATVFLHDRLHGVRNGIVEVVWDIQGRGKLQ